MLFPLILRATCTDQGSNCNYLRWTSNGSKHFRSLNSNTYHLTSFLSCITSWETRGYQANSWFVGYHRHKTFQPWPCRLDEIFVLSSVPVSPFPDHNAYLIWTWSFLLIHFLAWPQHTNEQTVNDERACLAMVILCRCICLG